MYKVFLAVLITAPTLLIPATLKVLENVKHQKMDGIGVNCYAFPIANDMGWNWEKVKFVFDDLNLHYVRLVTWFDWWKPKNDDRLDKQYSWKNFDPQKIIANHDHEMAKFFKKKGFDLALGIWNGAEWLAKGTPRKIDEVHFAELAESITAYLLWQRDHQTAFQYVEIQNEPDIEADIQYDSPEKLKKAYLELCDALNEKKIKVSFYLPDLSEPNETVKWAKVLLVENVIRKRTAAISYHTWWIEDEREYRKIADFAKSQGLPVWATEVGYCALKEGCFGGTHFLRPKTWETAQDYALSYYLALAFSDASRVYHWTLLGHDAAVGQNGEKFSSYYVLKHFANFIPKNCYRIETASSDEQIKCLAFELKNGLFSAILINTSKKEKVLEIKRTKNPATILEAFSSTKKTYFADTDFPFDGKGLILPGDSVTSVIFH